MRMWVDGACQTTADGNSIGAAAAIVQHNSGTIETHTAIIPSSEVPTPQRVGLIAVILALEQAAEKQPLQVFSEEEMLVIIYTNSAYARGCMTTWIPAHIDESCIDVIRAGSNNTAAGGNRDLIEHAVNLQVQVEQCGRVVYEWIPNEQNLSALYIVESALDAYQNGHY